MKKPFEIRKTLPKVKNTTNALLIYDQILARNPKINKWIRSFPCRYSVRSGEGLKDVNKLPLHLKRIMCLKTPIHEVYVIGGGTVGDFGGFVASILKRGVPVYQIPSTWLSALDSSHGGKTALNVSGFKNQIGTFHYPQKIWIVEEVLNTQSPERLYEAAGEFLKTAMIGGDDLLKKMKSWNWLDGLPRWRDLGAFIDVKYKIIKKDPYEKKGDRFILNLGHTMGHLWEARFGVPHGLAVFHGLLFDLAWSVHEGHFSARRSFQLMDEIPWSFLWDRQFQDRVDKKLFSLSSADVKKYLMQDKKLKNDGMRCTFIRRPGQVFIKTMKINDILKEYQRQQRILKEFYENL